MPVLQLDFRDYSGWRIHCPACGHPVLDDGADRADSCDHLCLYYSSGRGLLLLAPRLRDLIPDAEVLRPATLMRLFRSSPSRVLFRLRVDGALSGSRSHWLGFELREVLLSG